MKNHIKNEDINKIIRENKAVILQFGSSSCMPCIAIEAKLDTWGKNHPDVVMRYISIEQFPSLAAQRNILSAPTVVLYVNGKRTLKEAGHFSLDAFLDQTERYLRLEDENEYHDHLW